MTLREVVTNLPRNSRKIGDTPLLSFLKKFGEICLLWKMEKFHGWDASAAWDDLKILRKYKKTIKRIAVVGDKDWERWLEKTVKLFTKVEVRYFDHARRQRAWIRLKEQPEAK